MGSRGWLRLALVVGLVHAGFSAWWAFGGDWLAQTVGSWAVDWRAESPVTVGVVLLTVALGKGALAIGPLLIVEARDSHRRLRWAARLAGVGMLAYGALNALGAWIALSGVVDAPAADPTSPDHPALLGHALLWDPLFALWGAALLIGLRSQRSAPSSTVGRPRRKVATTRPGSTISR